MSRFPRFYRDHYAAADQANVDRAISEAGGDTYDLATGPANPRHHSPPTTPGDKRKLRGIPCVTAGVGGTQQGTDPYTETCRRMGIR